MLQNLHVKNLALIDEVEIDFQRGLNILTGETGAGKSIILGSVSLALGARYSTDILRKGAQYGLVELTFTVEDEKQERRLNELDVFPEDGTVVLSRRLMEGRSTSKINGETVPIALLKEVAGVLIDIHGQHEHQSLLYKKRQLELLDTFASDAVREAKENVRASFAQYRKWAKELQEADSDEAERAKEAAFLAFEIREIEEADLQDGEDEELEELYRRMVNSRRIAEGVHEAHAYTSEGSGSASDALSRAARCLSDAAGLDEGARALYDQLLEVDSLLNDFNRELADYEKGLEFSDEEYARTESRLNEINRLKTKYGHTVEEIRAYCEEKKSRLLVLEDYDRYLEELKEKYEKSLKHLEMHTSTLSRIRREMSLRFAEQITEGLQDLNFADVRFEISFSELPEYTANGKDDAAYLISMNPGEPLLPLCEVASGGELSRIMLAIKTVMADRDDIPTLIFDEIDVGISGRTAQKVSEKMAVIGRTHQVICITHLAQIAAQADAHYLIEKTVEDGRTRTGIRQLTDGESVEELARILGGAKITDAVLENAREMKELARGGSGK